MAKKEMYPIERKMDEDDLNRLIKSLERSTKMLKRLLFVKYRYDGDSVEEAAKRIDITKMIGYIWQGRWNQNGYRGLIPRYAGKGPSKMSEEQRSLLKDRLKDGQYTTAHVRDIIRNEFGIEYTMKQAWIILKKMGMRHAKPYHHDKRRPKDAEDALKKT